MEPEFITFSDGSKLIIQAESGQAYANYMAHLRPALERLYRDLARERGVCCDRLRRVIWDKKSRPPDAPRLAFLGEADLAGLGASWRYPGATRPGYYKIYDVCVASGEEAQITYIRLAFCPFCATDLRGIEEGPKDER